MHMQTWEDDCDDRQDIPSIPSISLALPSLEGSYLLMSSSQYRLDKSCFCNKSKYSAWIWKYITPDNLGYRDSPPSSNRSFSCATSVCIRLSGSTHQHYHIIMHWLSFNKQDPLLHMWWPLSTDLKLARRSTVWITPHWILCGYKHDDGLLEFTQPNTCSRNKLPIWYVHTGTVPKWSEQHR